MTTPHHRSSVLRSSPLAVVAPMPGEPPTPRTRLLRIERTSGAGGALLGATLDDATARTLMADARRWVIGYGASRAEADDIVQDAMLELLVALDRFRGEASIRSYARPIVMRTASHRTRRHRRGRALCELVGEIDVPSAAADPERDVMLRALVARVEAALGALAEHSQRAFIACAVERLSHDEAAALEGVSVETLRARLKRARAALVAALAHDPDLCRARRAHA